MNHIPAVQNIVAACGRGDIAIMLGHQADDAGWEHGHIWHFDASGKVARFCHKTDTLQRWLAFRST